MHVVVVLRQLLYNGLAAEVKIHLYRLVTSPTNRSLTELSKYEHSRVLCRLCHILEKLGEGRPYPVKHFLGALASERERCDEVV